MKIGLIADTHGNLDGWRRAWEFLHDSDLIVHCGDLLYHGPRFDPAPDYNPRALAEVLNACPVPLLITQGNADSEVDALFVRAPIQAPYVFAQVEGQRLLATHGHRVPLDKTLEQAQQWGVDLVVTAHLHVPCAARHGAVRAGEVAADQDAMRLGKLRVFPLFIWIDPALLFGWR